MLIPFTSAFPVFVINHNNILLLPSKAELLDAAAGVHIKFRLAGVSKHFSVKVPLKFENAFNL